MQVVVVVVVFLLQLFLSEALILNMIVLRETRVVLGHGLGTLGHGVLGKLRGKQKTCRSLNFPSGEGAHLVDLGNVHCLALQAVEHILNKRAHHLHRSLRERDILEHLLQGTVDEERPAGGTLLGALLLCDGAAGLLGHCLLTLALSLSLATGTSRCDWQALSSFGWWGHDNLLAGEALRSRV